MELPKAEKLTIFAMNVLMNKNNLFKEAFFITNHLILWNIPQRKNLLTKELKKETEERLWKKNTLDKLIYQKLGEAGWTEGDINNLSEKEWLEIEEKSQELKAFIEKLEKQANKSGELAFNLQKNRNKSLQEWIKENS